MSIKSGLERTICNLADRVRIKYKPKYMYESFQSFLDDENEIHQQESGSKYK